MSEVCCDQRWYGLCPVHGMDKESHAGLVEQSKRVAALEKRCEDAERRLAAAEKVVSIRGIMLLNIEWHLKNVQECVDLGLNALRATEAKAMKCDCVDGKMLEAGKDGMNREYPCPSCNPKEAKP